MFVYYINIPLNEKGINEMNNYDETLANVKTFELTEDEYNVLRSKKGLFEKFDDKFGTIIDVCEEERIEFENLSEAYELTKSYRAKSDLEIEAIQKIMESLSLAIESKTFWEIDIYLE